MDKVTNPEIPAMIKKLIDNPHVDQRTKDGFLSSIDSYYRNKNFLTNGQFIALERISKNYTDCNNDWYNDYHNSDKKENFKVAVDYYRRTSYFVNIVSKVAKDSGYVPTPAEYRSICENKYAKILIDGYRAKPKFNIGDNVRTRSMHSHYAMTGIGTILEVMPYVERAVRGNKIYKVYFVESGQSLMVDEYKIALARQKDYDKLASEPTDNGGIIF